MVILFGIFILAPRLSSVYGLNAGMLASISIAVLYFVRSGPLLISVSLLRVIAFLLLLGVYNVVVALINGNEWIYFTGICITFSISLVLGWMNAHLIMSYGISRDRLFDWTVAMLGALLALNSTLIIIEYLIPGVRVFFEAFLESPIGLDYSNHPFRLRGLAAAGGAGLSLANALAVLCLLQTTKTKSFISPAIAVFMAATITVSNVVVGRTGLIFGIVFFAMLMALVIVRIFKNRFSFINLFVMFGVTVAIFKLLENFDDEGMYSAFEWMSFFETGRLETSSTDELAGTLALPNTITHILAGYGYFEGPHRDEIRSDSGFLKTFASVGVLLGLSLYTIIVALIWNIRKVAPHATSFLALMLFMLLIAEIKEPFFYQNFVARMLALLIGAALYSRFALRNTSD